MSNIAALAMVVSSGSASATVILTFNSDTTVASAGGALDGSQLAAISSDADFVTSSDSITSTNSTTTSRTHIAQSTGVLGSTAPAGAIDIAFNFSNAGAIPAGTATFDGAFIGAGFVAAQDFNLTEFSVLADPNNGGSLNGARDVSLFVSLDGITFTQFGTTSDNANNGLSTNIFTDSLAVSVGDTVEFRAAFDDSSGSTVNNLQSFTRVGQIQISAEAIPEPSSTALLGLGGLTLLLRRRR